MNAYSSGAQKIIPAVLIYPFWDDEVLLIQKNSDVHSGKWNGLGGKMEFGETPWEASRRELHEEAGILLRKEAFLWMGNLQFPQFKPDRSEDWWVTVFVVDLKAEGVSYGEWRAECREGRIALHEKARIPELPMWEGDRLFLPWVMERQPFVGCLFYEKGRVVKHDVRPLK